MNNNWESLIRAIVPLSFMAIWALTSLFNRDTKPKPVIRPTPRPEGARGGMLPSRYPRIVGRGRSKRTRISRMPTDGNG